jgi:hypothetical protein
LWECSSEPCIDRIVGTVEGGGVAPRSAYINWRWQQAAVQHMDREGAFWSKVVRKWQAVKHFVNKNEHWIVVGFWCALILLGCVLQTLAVVLK